MLQRKTLLSRETLSLYRRLVTIAQTLSRETYLSSDRVVETIVTSHQ